MPKVFVIGKTEIDMEGMEQYFSHMSADKWYQENIPFNEKTSDGEKLTEVYSRSCYKSFGVGLNPNVTKVREGNEEHLKNIIKSRHGSVLEHVVVNFMFCDVSRVFTHELVRHRAGVAISQESLRYVRLDKLKGYLPDCFVEHPYIKVFMKETFEILERAQKECARYFKLDEEKNFGIKKQITSAMRRLAPIGLATNIGWSANLRTLRHIIPLRTHHSAEEEIRKVFVEVGHMMKKRYPNVFQDFILNKTIDDSIGEWGCVHEKI